LAKQNHFHVTLLHVIETIDYAEDENALGLAIPVIATMYFHEHRSRMHFHFRAARELLTEFCN
jgi:hypothetical protein